jgi:uncharacterized protein (DUF4415 family)
MTALNMGKPAIKRLDCSRAMSSWLSTPNLKRLSVLFPPERQQNMKKKPTSTKSQTDFARLDKMKDEDIDLSDAPEITPEMFAKAIVRRGLKPRTKTQLTLRVDSDVLEWYKKQGRGYQTRINQLLRAYMQEHQR